ncbi:MAG: hypothetical protein ABII26_03570 [Pseudomonadota bacterium]
MKTMLPERSASMRSRPAITTSTLKTPHTVEEDYGDPAELLAKLKQGEAETAKLRDRFKAIREEALLR